MATENALQLESLGNGVWAAPGARIVDRTGRKRLPIGHDRFERAAEGSVFVDKTMLIADVLDSGYAATLFCRPRRFGKTFNLTMLKAFLEMPPDGVSLASLFEGTYVWEADDGRYREHQGAYPVINMSFRTVKKDTWDDAYGAIRNVIVAEYGRHDYLLTSDRLSENDRRLFRDISSGGAAKDQYADALLTLATMLRKHHGCRIVVLIDEYDAPVMAGYSAPDGGYYREVVGFLKGLFTGALKDGGGAVEFSCLTGVQRISKESIFSDFNNLVVSTPLDPRFDERFGFTDAEAAALAAYLGHTDCMPEMRAWYDGYRFGETAVYNPWSVLNYLERGCSPDDYWANTSGNSVVGDLVTGADQGTMEQIYALLEPNGVVEAPLDLAIVFPDVGVRQDAVWSMLYLAGYLTTEDVALPNSAWIPRRLRVPNAEVAELYRREVVGRFVGAIGGRRQLDALQHAIVVGDTETVASELTRIVRDSASFFDLTTEQGCHMLLLGLCFGMTGYADPVSNREQGRGRPDIRIEPVASPFSRGARPLVTLEVKHAKGDSSDDELSAVAQAALAQIAERGYDEGSLPPEACGRLRWGIAFGDKRVAAACERAEG